jgi:hypothetical protein
MIFDGFCFRCGGYIEPGREVVITGEQGQPKVLCPGCAGGSESAEKLNDTTTESRFLATMLKIYPICPSCPY